MQKKVKSATIRIFKLDLYKMNQVQEWHLPDLNQRWVASLIFGERIFPFKAHDWVGSSS